jgi:hypothetical protein
MGRARWRYPRLLAFCLLSLLLTVITVLLSNWLMAPGLPRDLVQNCAPNIGELITLGLLAPLLPYATRRSRRLDDGNGTDNQNKFTDSHDD